MSVLPPDIALRATNLTKVYRKGQSHETLHALNSVSFEIQKGEVLGVIGSNGAGKSTLLKVLSEITAPTSGSVEYRGRLTSILDVGTGFHPDLSGTDNVFLNGSILGYTKEEITKALPDIIEFSGLEEFMSVPVKQYSSGMYLRLAFSVAFNFPVEVLLIDEVLAVGDARFKQKCFDKLEEIVQNGISIILVTHDTRQLAELCNRCILLDQGSVKLSGATRKVIEAYLERKPKRQVESNADDQIKLLNASLNSDNASKLFGLEEPIKVILNVEKIEAHKSFELFLYIYDINGMRVLMDSVLLHKDYEPKNFKPGTYEVSCTIPGGLLNVGSYVVGVMVAQNKNRIAEWNEVITFKVDQTNQQSKNHFLEGMACAMKPALDWKYIYNHDNA
ncbi:MAG: ABC transporter ATP-binding protein [Salibacteraceae bacterium]